MNTQFFGQPSRQPLIAVKHSIGSQPDLPNVTYGVDKDASPTELGMDMKTDLSNGQ